MSPILLPRKGGAVRGPEGAPTGKGTKSSLLSTCPPYLSPCKLPGCPGGHRMGSRGPELPSRGVSWERTPASSFSALPPGGLPEGLRCSFPGSSQVILAGSKMMEFLRPSLTADADAGWVSCGAGSLLSRASWSCLWTLTAEIHSMRGAACHGFGTWLSFSQMHTRARTSSLGNRLQPPRILGTILNI